MKNKLWQMCFLFILFTSFLFSEDVSISVETEREYIVLENFFRFAINEVEFFYVLEGDKPIFIHGFRPLDQFPFGKELSKNEREFEQTLLMREAIPFWKKRCSSQKKYVLKTITEKESGFELILFVNLPKLQQVIEENIYLFRYILSPTLDPKVLTQKIAYSNQSLGEILQYNSMLVGIVLGFGTHNSILCGRHESIQSQMLSQDEAPFGVKNQLLHNIDYFKNLFDLYYLEIMGGDRSIFQSLNNNPQTLVKKNNSKDLKEELFAIENATEPLPDCLINETPAFIFGAYKGDVSNQPFFDKLRQTQKKAQILLKSPHFFEEILTKIGGKKPKILCKKPTKENVSLSFFANSISLDSWKEIIEKVSTRFRTERERNIFMNSFSSDFDSDTLKIAPPSCIGASPFMLDGIKRAVKELSMSDAHFDALSQDTTVHSIVPNFLYYKTIKEGFDKELKNSTRVRVGYSIKDAQGNILFAHFDNSIDLTDTIQGFAHGLQGMKVGETREIFIHPRLAYGAFSTLPTLELVATVELHDIDETHCSLLSTPELLDVSWVQDPSLFEVIEESIDQVPLFAGYIYKHLLDKIDPKITLQIKSPKQ
jgi:hypothetical protein